MITSFDFDTSAMTSDTMVDATLRMFLHLGFVEQFRIPYDKLCRWLLSVRKSYRNGEMSHQRAPQMTAGRSRSSQAAKAHQRECRAPTHSRLSQLEPCI